MDLESIYVYIAGEAGVAVADRMIDAITGTCEDLALFPNLGKHRPELDDLGLEVRSIGERGYVIFYAKHEGRLHIVRVLHGARDIGPDDLEALSEVV